MKKPLRTLPPACGSKSLSRRNAVRQVGGWAIYLGAVTVAACGRTPLGDPLGGFIPGDDDDDDAATTPTTTLTPTPTPLPCTCDPVSGAPLGINASALPVGAFAVNTGLKLFLCHDAAGFYAMSDLCTHASLHMIDYGAATYNPNTNDLAAGFRCGHQNSRFNAEGAQTQGPAPAGSYLQHYLLTKDAAGDLFIDVTKIVDFTCRCP